MCPRDGIWQTLSSTLSPVAECDSSILGRINPASLSSNTLFKPVRRSQKRLSFSFSLRCRFLSLSWHHANAAVGQFPLDFNIAALDFCIQPFISRQQQLRIRIVLQAWQGNLCHGDRESAATLQNKKQKRSAMPFSWHACRGPLL